MSDDIGKWLKKKRLQNVCIVAGMIGMLTYIGTLIWHAYLYKGTIKDIDFTSMKEITKIFKSGSSGNVLVYVLSVDTFMVMLYGILFFGALKKCGCFVCTFVTVGIFRIIIGILFLYPLIKKGSYGSVFVDSIDISILLCVVTLSYSFNQQIIMEGIKDDVIKRFKDIQVDQTNRNDPPLYAVPTSRYFMTPPPLPQTAPPYNHHHTTQPQLPDGGYAVPKIFQ